ncbi:hypothetical protein [Marinilabilia sp.]|uniref:hypothetical protein n=1 Tax=Marinilabilia sp. TaxID=2021252 RepID=UPI0025BA9D43|nr:hypothetical protein [Marinilabilia sp.]
MNRFIQKVLYISIITLITQFIVGNVLHEKRNKLVEEVYFPVKRWKEFYAHPKKSVGMIFLGSSHCYRSLVPSVFDSVLNVNSFNLGSSSQSISTSYYVLREALKFQSPKTVVLEIFQGTITNGNTYIDVMHNFSQMQSNVKYAMLQTVSLNEALSLAAFPLKRVAINKDQILLNKKVLPDTTRAQYSIYYDKGYVATFSKNIFQFAEQEIEPNAPFSINDLQLEYLHKINQLCLDNQIKLIAVTQPLHPAYWKNHPEKEIYDEISNTLNELSIPYYNLNHTHPLPAEFFYDAGHILHQGAILFSRDVANLLEQNQ